MNRSSPEFGSVAGAMKFPANFEVFGESFEVSGEFFEVFGGCFFEEDEWKGRREREPFSKERET